MKAGFWCVPTTHWIRSELLVSSVDKCSHYSVMVQLILHITARTEP